MSEDRSVGKGIQNSFTKKRSAKKLTYQLPRKQFKEIISEKEINYQIVRVFMIESKSAEQNLNYIANSAENFNHDSVVTIPSILITLPTILTCSTYLTCLTIITCLTYLPCLTCLLFRWWSWLRFLVSSER